MGDFTFKKVGGAKNYIKYSECEEGQVIAEGEYIGRSDNKFGKQNFDFKGKDGKITCLNHAGGLAYTMENNVVEGDYVRVTYAGKTMLTSGDFKGKEVHNFDVEVAEIPKAVETKKIDTAKIKEVQEQTLNLADLE